MQTSFLKSRYTVNATSAGTTLPPITIQVDVTHSPMRLQDYLTPDEADALGDALKTEAAKARGAEELAA